jgi:hypothetical protein
VSLKFLLELLLLGLEVEMMGSFTVESAVSFPGRKHKPSFITGCDHGKKCVFGLIVQGLEYKYLFFLLTFWHHL